MQNLTEDMKSMMRGGHQLDPKDRRASFLQTNKTDVLGMSAMSHEDSQHNSSGNMESADGLTSPTARLPKVYESEESPDKLATTNETVHETHHNDPHRRPGKQNVETGGQGAPQYEVAKKKKQMRKAKLAFVL